ncbi:hypothetical protein RKS58_07905 [Lysinibacillus capsici]|uniref:hypothetical protein n=1 Tax=Lysinibacillus capsici TaxID=2115968 RepID=UPI0028BDCC58|nr:hypothetical protein [Lysinibacillus capsici]WNN77754.1 hypothetical protein RKS58_07905 [Lysinibacillus capsici]
MNFEKIVSHCVVIEITAVEDENYWYANLIGEHLVAFGCDEDLVYCCHHDNQYNSVGTVPLSHCKVVQGRLNQLWDMG